MIADQKIKEIAAISVERVTFGVRFQPRYEIIDHFGAIIDRILRTKGTPFGPTTFPLSSREAGEHRLLNTETKNELRLTESDAILDMLIDSRKMHDIKNLAENYSIYILESLRDIARLRDIVRYGILFRLKECRNTLKETPSNYYMSQDFKDTRSLSLRFTRRLPVLEALSRKKVDDYRNVIYTIKQTEEGEVKIWIDYQEYFKPELDSNEWSDKPFKEFVDQGISYFEGEFSNWLQKLMIKPEAA